MMMRTALVVFLFGAATAVAQDHKLHGSPNHTPTFSFEGGTKYAEMLFSVPVRGKMGLSCAMYRALESSVAYCGPEVTLKKWGFALAPGAGLLFGQQEPKPGGAAMRVRAEYESKRFFGEFSGIHSLSSFEDYRDTYIVATFEAKLSCWTDEACKLGLTGEHLGHRAKVEHHAETKHKLETEDLVGVGGGYSLPKIPHLPRFELTGKVLFPIEGKALHHREYRIGVAFHPKH
jgi:hypothetical protein